MGYMDQGNKTRTLDSSVKGVATSNNGASRLLEQAKGSTVGIVGDKGIAPGGLPVGKGGK
jgi:hypothetical protein